MKLLILLTTLLLSTTESRAFEFPDKPGKEGQFLDYDGKWKYQHEIDKESIAEKPTYLPPGGGAGQFLAWDGVKRIWIDLPNPLEDRLDALEKRLEVLENEKPSEIKINGEGGFWVVDGDWKQWINTE